MCCASIACDSITESPEPDRFASTPLKAIVNTTDSNGIFYIDVIGENQIKSEVSVSFSEAKLGTITPDAENNRFIYQARDNANGIDSFQYFMQRGGLKKEGQIQLTVKMPCVPQSCQVERYELGDLTPDTSIFIPFDTRDAYCSTRNVVITTESPTSRFTLGNVQDAGFYIRPKGVLKQSGPYNVAYRVVHPGHPPIAKVAGFNLTIDNAYCDKVFNVKDIANPFEISSTDFHTVNRDALKRYVTVCDDELVLPDNWLICPDGVVEYINPPKNSIAKIRKSALSEVRYGFIFKNTRQLTDTGYATIIFH